MTPAVQVGALAAVLHTTERATGASQRAGVDGACHEFHISHEWPIWLDLSRDESSRD